MPTLTVASHFGKKTIAPNNKRGDTTTFQSEIPGSGKLGNTGIGSEGCGGCPGVFTLPGLSSSGWLGNKSLVVVILEAGTLFSWANCSPVLLRLSKVLDPAVWIKMSLILTPGGTWMKSLPFPKSVMISKPPPVDSTNLSFPSPPVRVSFPWSPERKSSPASPKSWSLPFPPNKLSFPSPPLMISSFASPRIESLPLPPSTKSLSLPPIRVSLPAPPEMLSWPSFPRINSLSADPMTVSLPPRTHAPPGIFASCPGDRVIDSEVSCFAFKLW